MAWTSPKTWSTGATVPASDLNTHVRDNLNALAPDGATSASWTPTVDGNSGGSTAVADSGYQYQVGAMQFAGAYWNDFNILAPVGGASGVLQVALPATASGVTAGAGGQVIGSWRLLDDSATGSSLSGAVYLSAGGTCRFGLPEGNVLTSTTIAPASGDRFSFCVQYPVA